MTPVQTNHASPTGFPRQFGHSIWTSGGFLWPLKGGYPWICQGKTLEVKRIVTSRGPLFINNIYIYTRVYIDIYTHINKHMYIYIIFEHYVHIPYGSKYVLRRYFSPQIVP